MNVLFFVEPLIEKNQPYWKGYWSNYCCANIAETLGGVSNYKFSIILNEPLAENFNNLNIDKIILTQQELLKPFSGGYLEASIKWYKETWTSQELNYYVALFRAKLTGFTPDLIVTFSPIPYISIAFPNALILHHEYSIFSRLPYPSSWFLDPIGMSEYSFLNKFKDDLFNNKLSSRAVVLIKDFKFACNNAISLTCPFTDLIDIWKSVFKQIYLLPLQDSGYYSFDGIVHFKSQIEYLVSVLKSISPDIGLIVTMHPEYKVLSGEVLGSLNEEHSNLLYSKRFDDYKNASQYLIPYVDAIITVSSSVGVQSLFFEKKLITYGRCFSYLPSNNIDEDSKFSSIDIEKQERVLYWLITHYAIREAQLRDPEWFNEFIVKSVNKFKTGELTSYFYDMLGDPETIFCQITSDIIANLTNIPEKTQVNNESNYTYSVSEYNETNNVVTMTKYEEDNSNSFNEKIKSVINIICEKPKYQVAVVIPIYKTDLTEYETISLDRCLKIFRNRKIIILSPEGLPLNKIKLLSSVKYEIQSFPESNFSSIETYNHLLLSSDFYISFIEYKYILIYQLDAFVFQDQLIDWCKLPYDYIGAPWFGVDWFNEHHKPGFGNLWGHFRYKKCMVGNGGFSLRRIRSFLFALMVLKNKAENWTHNEDLFWSFEVPNNLPFFKKPDLDLALKFSFELNPRECFDANKRILPFGCHAWEKYDIDFWRPKFAAYGYQI